ncbi:MAG TPA: M20/M25/M40 family metallo-hydrolase [Dissulfurispiraceae bacterium]|nr:M20/M25/M40 family metallo-hydrolase [Dissulfurispiraceae bacterium]
MNIRQMINEQRLVETFIRLAGLNSPSLEEEEIGRELVHMLHVRGARVEVQRFGQSFNVIARKSGTVAGDRPLLLGAHMDTVEPTAGIQCITAEGIIKTSGTTILGADNKSALAQILETLTVLEERGLPHPPLEIVFTSAEEKGLLGARNLAVPLLLSRHCIILDISGPPGLIVTAAPAREQFNITVRGRAAHAGIEPEKGINAVRIAAEIIAALPNGRLDGETTFNVSSVGGGSSSNIVPKEATIHGEFRTHSERRKAELSECIRMTARAAAERFGAGVAVQIETEYEAFRIDSNHPFLAFAESVLRECNLVPRRIVTGGGSDANILNRHGICCLNLSNGMRDIHTTDEHIAVTDLVTGAEMLIRAACSFLSCR